MVLLFIVACSGGAGPGAKGDGEDSAPAGVASFSADALVWTDLTPGFSVQQTLDVTNLGTGPLDVTEAAIVTDPSDVFTVSFSALSLDPGDLGSVMVSALLIVEGPAAGELRLRTSDPNASAPVFDLTVN